MLSDLYMGGGGVEVYITGSGPKIRPPVLQGVDARQDIFYKSLSLSRTKVAS